MKNIPLKQDGPTMVVGTDPVLISDSATGKQIHYTGKTTRPHTVMCGRKSGVVIRTGTAQEIAAEKTVQDAKYAPIKAQLEAAKAGK